MVIDVRSSASFADGHVPGAINIPSNSLVQWAGFFVDYNMPLYLLTDADSISSNLRSLRLFGIDKVEGYFDTKANEIAQKCTESYRSESPLELIARIENGSVGLFGRPSSN